MRIFVAVTAAVALCALTFYLVPQMQFDRRTLGLTWMIAIIRSGLSRLLFERMVDQDIFKSRVVVYGAGKLATSLLALRRRSDQRGFRLVGFMPTPGDPPAVPADRLIETPQNLFEWAEQNEIDQIVVAMDDRRQGFPLHDFLACRLAGIQLLELPTFLERETGKVHLEIMHPSWIIFGEGFRVSQLQSLLERTFDVVVSSLLLLVGLPAMLLTVVAILIESKTAGVRPSFIASNGSASTVASSMSSSSVACAWTPKSPESRNGRYRTIPGSRAWVRSSAKRGSTKCRSSGTCCAVT